MLIVDNVSLWTYKEERREMFWFRECGIFWIWIKGLSGLLLPSHVIQLYPGRRVSNAWRRDLITFTHKYNYFSCVRMYFLKPKRKEDEQEWNENQKKKSWTHTFLLYGSNVYTRAWSYLKVLRKRKHLSQCSFLVLDLNVFLCGQSTVNPLKERRGRIEPLMT